MYKCWSCGTEHEGNDEAAYNRGWNAASQNMYELKHEVQVLRAVIQHMVNKYEIDEPKINSIPVSQWTGQDSKKVVTTDGT